MRRCRRPMVALLLLFSFVSLTGSLYPLLGRIVMTSKFPWKNDLELEFRKPFFHVLLYFLIPSVLIFPWVLTCRTRKTLSGMDCVKTYRVAALPAILNCIATYGEFISLLAMPTIVWQSFHSWQVLFVPVFMFLSRQMPLYFNEWIGLFVVVIGIAVCGVSSLLRSIHNKGETSQMFFSYIIMIFSCAVRAYQCVYEQKLLKVGGFTSLQLTAFEGTWGFCLTLLIVVPLVNILSVDNMLYENTVEVFEFVSRSATLVLLEILFAVSAGVTMYLSMVLVDKVGPSTRFSVEVVRPIIVLIGSYIAHYSSNISTVGEEFDRFSSGEVIGMSVSLLGVFMSSRILQFPCLAYQEPDDGSDMVSQEFVLH